MLPYQTIITIDREDKLAIYLQISQQMTNQIVSGRISPGTKLPGSRKMSVLLGVNRNTIIAAYEELGMQGWLDTKNSSGTFVKSKLPIVVNTGTHKPHVVESYDKGTYTRESELLFQFDDGQPDVRLAPLLALTREMSALVKTDYFHKHLNYTDDLRGDIKLREEVCKYLKETRGISTTADCVLLTRGTVNSFHLYLNNFLSEDDCVIVGKPGYMTFNHIVEETNAVLRHVQVDAEGMDVEEVEKICMKDPVKLVYAIPHHHHPTTVRMSSDRRLKLIQLSQAYGFAILEDDYDYDFHYDSSPVLPLASYDNRNKVIYVGSFSKLLVPSIRLGFMVAPSSMIDILSEKRRYVDRCGNPLIERAMANLMKSGDIKRSLRKALHSYKSRRDLLSVLLKQHLTDHLTFEIPAGGMAIWVTFKDYIDLPLLAENCNAEGLGISIPEHYNEDSKKRIRMGFAMMDENEIRLGFEILKSNILIQVV